MHFWDLRRFFFNLLYDLWKKIPKMHLKIVLHLDIKYQKKYNRNLFCLVKASNHHGNLIFRNYFGGNKKKTFNSDMLTCSPVFRFLMWKKNKPTANKLLLINQKTMLGSYVNFLHTMGCNIWIRNMYQVIEIDLKETMSVIHLKHKDS